MKTSYGLEFNLSKEINPLWSDYDKCIAQAHLYSFGFIIVLPASQVHCEEVLDNEYDIENIMQSMKLKQ